MKECEILQEINYSKRAHLVKHFIQIEKFDITKQTHRFYVIYTKSI